MKKTGIYIAIGALAVLGATILAAKRVQTNRRKRKEEFDKLIAINNQNNQGKIDALQTQYNNAIQQKEEDIKGVKAGKFAHRLTSGSGTNVRTSPYVNNGGINNIKYKHTSKSKKIGLIIQPTKSSEYGDKKTWYLVKLDNGTGEGYVREDGIIIKNI